jgi:hypothetical protein
VSSTTDGLRSRNKVARRRPKRLRQALVAALLISLGQFALLTRPAGATQGHWYWPCEGLPSIDLIQVNPNVAQGSLWGWPQCSWIGAHIASNLFGTIYYSDNVFAFSPNASNGYFFVQPATLYGNPVYLSGTLATVSNSATRHLNW